MQNLVEASFMKAGYAFDFAKLDTRIGGDMFCTSWGMGATVAPYRGPIGY